MANGQAFQQRTLKEKWKNQVPEITGRGTDSKNWLGNAEGVSAISFAFLRMAESEGRKWVNFTSSA